MEQKTNPYFQLQIEKGQYTTKNAISYYRSNLPDESMTYDISNQKALANLNVFGNLKTLTFYQQNFLTEEKPGVWANKQLTQTQNISFSVTVNRVVYQLDDKHHRVTVDVEDNLNPRFVHEYAGFSLTVRPFCPIVKGERLSCMVYAFEVENTSNEVLEVGFALPQLYQKKLSDQQNVLIVGNQLDAIQVSSQKKTTAAIALIDPNCYQLVDLFAVADCKEWFADTMNYFRGRFGKLTMEDDYLTSLFQRAAYQSFAAFGMNREGQLVGSNWGSYPATKRIWNKDMYYSSLPFLFFDQELMEQTLLWFQQYAVKFPGTKFAGGASHSVSNALAPLLLASMYLDYYQNAFFEEHPEICEKGRQLVEELLATREDTNCYLVYSIWISDAYALGDYHTGTNICFWKACEGLAKLCYISGEIEFAERYTNFAEKIKADILKLLTIEGTYGRQFLEGADKKGEPYTSVNQYQQPILDQGLIFLEAVIEEEKINLLMHDGEESDTTLSAFYGFLSINDPLYQNSMRFAASLDNPTYSDTIEGITWGLGSGATFPGYMTMLMSSSHNAEAFQEKIEALKRLADLDGSWWWWPYPLNPEKGEVVRNFGCGKCGWASGIFVSLFISHYLGLSQKAGVLCFNPMDGLEEFTWENFRIGDKCLSIYFEKEQLVVRNLGDHPFELRVSDKRFTKSKLLVTDRVTVERKS
ncbi:glycoside hydrolase [Candidatus Enterococcus ferrettii]|uniref:Glycoside hydrolase n=1 Tax=Candidatus Enterococcus ferrettii TaxID=2815324 RepID=A0ABV0EN88_9ENTE|nr:glycoside hydrolase [Enterococcus sp. 665A]MBO1339062.1 glycoside hydrolase [Enterococcus sp. 665A]